MMQKRKYTVVQCQDLVAELQAYKSSSPPFNAPLGNVYLPAEAVVAGHRCQADYCAPLRIYIYDIVSHAATAERLFSLMGWYQSDRRNRLGVDST